VINWTLNVGATASGRLAHLLEKDVWVVWAKQHVFLDVIGYEARARMEGCLHQADYGLRKVG
jgi:hypothetical protein